MTFTTFCRLLSQAVIHSRQPVALNWARNSFGLVLTVFLRKICILGIAEYFLIVLFQISEIKKDEIRFKKYIVLLDMFLIVGGEGSSNRNASRDESVEAGDKSVEAGDESIEAGEKTPQSCYNNRPLRAVFCFCRFWRYGIHQMPQAYSSHIFCNANLPFVGVDELSNPQTGWSVYSSMEQPQQWFTLRIAIMTWMVLLLRGKLKM